MELFLTALKWWALSFPALVCITELFFLAVMCLASAIKAKKIPERWGPGLAILWIGWVFDVLLNHVYLSILLLDRPRWGEWLTTQRFQRLINDDGWRGNFVSLTSAEYLDPFDPKGYHVKKS